MLNSTSPSHRGVCAPGFVQSVGEDNSLLCLRELSYPRAFADPASYHDQYCGKCISAKLYSGKRNTHFSMLTVRTDSTTSPARGARQIWVSLGRLARKCSPQTRKEPPCKRRASKCGPESAKSKWNFLRALGWMSPVYSSTRHCRSR